jgi:26S proteasome regulatory subunit N9
VSLLEEFLASKRWYELGESLIALFREFPIPRNELFEGLIWKYGELLDPFHFTTLILLVADELESIEETLAFITRAQTSRVFEKFPEPKDLLNLRIVILNTSASEFEAALKLLNEIESRVNESTAITVRSAFHRTQADLDKARGDFDSFYSHALLYLSTARVDNDQTLAYDLCMASLFAESVCSFGELAALPVLKSLNGTDSEWLHDLILLLDKGESDSISLFRQKFVPIILSKADWKIHLDCIERKLALAVFLQVIFQRPFDSRVFKFDEIAGACQIEKNKVELLVAKALATGIIKGSIDEVKEKVTVTWCKPKALGNERLQHLKDEIDRWISMVHNQRVHLENRSQPVVG